MRGRITYPNTDGQVLKSSDGEGEVTVDLKNQRAKLFFKSPNFQADKETVDVPLAKDYLERGELFFVTRHHLLWLLKSPIDVPKSWNKEAVDGIQPSTPVIIFFKKEVEVYRKLYKDLPFKNIHRQIGLDYKTLNDLWLSDFQFIRPSQTHRVGNAAFIPKLILAEQGQGKKIELEVMTGRITELDKNSGPPQTTIPDEKLSPQDHAPQGPSPAINDNEEIKLYNKKMEQYFKDIALISDWYKIENKKLADKADSLSDKELNLAVEKLTADYNRKMLKLQQTMPELKKENPKK